MDYVEWLADTMIRVPVEHTLDAVNIADQYDAAAVKARLAMMTPQNARIWYISPNEPHNKTAYLSMPLIRWIKSANRPSLTGRKSRRDRAEVAGAEPLHSG
jgi:secreted Zn-dependent insulinase-like peptidase